MAVWVVSTVMYRLLRTMPIWTFMCRFLCRHALSFLMGAYQEAEPLRHTELLSDMAILC